MAQPNPPAVKVVEICRVAPQIPHDSSESGGLQDMTLPLTFFDLLWVRFGFFQRVFFYELSDTPLFSESVLPKLKASLSLTLQHFSPLAGNLTWPQDSQIPILSYVEGDSVSLTIADAGDHDHDHFHRLSSQEHLEPGEFHHLVPKLNVSHDRAAALAVQITVFPNCGFTIGTAMHHSVLDGKTSTMFFKMWSHLCKQDHQQLEIIASSSLLIDELKPCYSDRKLIQDPMGLEAIFSNQWLNMDGPNNRSLMAWQLKVPEGSIRSTFQFTQGNIQTLGDHVRNVMNSDNFHVSSFSLTCAYTWACLVKAEETKCDKVLIVFNVDCRCRLNPPLPATYFGNCVARCGAVAKTEELLGDDGLVVALKAISGAIKGLGIGGVLFDGAENWVSQLCDVQSNDVRVVSTAGSPKFEIYETDFGCGRPKRTEVVSVDKTGALCFSDSKNGEGGIEVGMALKEHNMRAFASLFAKGLEGLN